MRHVPVIHIFITTHLKIVILIISLKIKMNILPYSKIIICNRNFVVPEHICVFLPQVIQERRKERKTGIVKEKKDLLDLLMDTYDEETGTKMDDEELRAQVMYSASYMYKPCD